MGKKKVGARTAARKMKDKWRAKKWYSVISPDMFESVEIGETLADEPEKILGRITEITMQDLTNDFAKMHIKLQFKINEVKGLQAYTAFIGHTMTSDYVRRQTRRRRSKMDTVLDVTTKDGYTLRIKPMAFTDKRIQTSQAKAVRQKIYDIVEGTAKDSTMVDFVKVMLNGNMSTQIFKEVKPIYPLRRVDIRKSEILKAPKQTAPTPEQKEVAKEVEGAAPAEGEAAPVTKVKKPVALKQPKTVVKKVLKEDAPDDAVAKAVIKSFTELPGIGPSKAKALYEAGFTSITKLKAASMEQLTNIDKITPKVAEQIKEGLE